MLPEYQPGETTYGEVNQDNGIAEEGTQDQTPAAGLDRRKLVFSPIIDMAVHEGRLYFLSWGRSAGPTVWEYVDEKTAPKKSLAVGWYTKPFATNDERFKGRYANLNSLAVFNGKLYAGGNLGFFGMKSDGEWEYLEYPALGAKPGTLPVIWKLKVLNGELYALVGYEIRNEEYPEGIATDRLVKFTGSGWQDVPADYANSGLTQGVDDLAYFKGKYYVSGNGVVYKRKDDGENGLPYFDWREHNDEFKDSQGEPSLHSSNVLGNDDNYLYACGEGATLFRSSGENWTLVKEFGGEFPYCLFFKQVGGVLYFGVRSDRNGTDNDRGLFKIAGEVIEQVAEISFNASRDLSAGVSAMEEYKGEIFVGSKIGDGFGGIYKLKNGKLEELTFYTED